MPSDTCRHHMPGVFLCLQVLGIPPEADNNEINRAYARKKYEFRHESTNLQKVEQAHSSLMLSAFQQRVKVRVSPCMPAQGKRRLAHAAARGPCGVRAGLPSSAWRGGLTHGHEHIATSWDRVV